MSVFPDLVESRMRAHQVADRLGGQLTDLAPGERIGTKSQLRDRFGVALATINEALRILQSQGRIVLRSGPNGGAFVADPHPLLRIGEALVAIDGDPAAVTHAIELRAVLDPLCVEEAARARTPRDIEELRELLNAMSDNLDDDMAFAQSIWALHRRIAQIGQNALLREISLGLIEVIHRSARSIVPGSKTPAYKRKRVAVHKALVDAIESGDRVACARASRRHVEQEDHSAG